MPIKNASTIVLVKKKEIDFFLFNAPSFNLGLHVFWLFSASQKTYRVSDIEAFLEKNAIHPGENND